MSLLDSAGGVLSSFFRIDIVPGPPGSPPQYLAFALTSPVLHVDAVPYVKHKSVFGSSFTRGRANLTALATPLLKWTAAVGNRSLFASDPIFSFAADAAWNGVVGVVEFELRVYECGSSDIKVSASYAASDAQASGAATAAVSAAETSAEKSFSITAACCNYPPVVAAIRDVSIEEDAGRVSLACWLTNLSTGSPYERQQSLNVFPVDVQVLQGMYKAGDMIRNLRFTPRLEAACAYLSFEVLLTPFSRECLHENRRCGA